MKTSEQPSKNETTEVLGSETQSKRLTLLEAFNNKYRCHLEYENQPSEATLALVLKQHARRTIEFIPLSRVTSAADGRTSIIEPVRLGKSSPFLIDTSMINVGGRKHSDFNKSPENFTHAVRVLMYAYVLASAPDPIETTWCSLEAARSHISVVEQYSRLSTAAGGTFAHRIMEIELAIRSEWVRTHHREPLLSLSEVITIVSQQTTLWPMAHEFRAPTRQPPTKGPGQKGGWKGDTVVT